MEIRFIESALPGSGTVVVFVADHFVRPVLIGGAARLPFIWVLFGLLGGLETLGFIGLFLGPAIMAALVSLWRDWTGSPERGDSSGGRMNTNLKRLMAAGTTLSLNAFVRRSTTSALMLLTKTVCFAEKR